MPDCMAVTLIAGSNPGYPASYHWCKTDAHDVGEKHVCYCGTLWLESEEMPLVEMTADMQYWRKSR